jgi:hypothetical protein
MAELASTAQTPLSVFRTVQMEKPITTWKVRGVSVDAGKARVNIARNGMEISMDRRAVVIVEPPSQIKTAGPSNQAFVEKHGPCIVTLTMSARTSEPGERRSVTVQQWIAPDADVAESRLMSHTVKVPADGRMRLVNFEIDAPPFDAPYAGIEIHASLLSASVVTLHNYEVRTTSPPSAGQLWRASGPTVRNEVYAYDGEPAVPAGAAMASALLRANIEPVLQSVDDAVAMLAEARSEAMSAAKSTVSRRTVRNPRLVGSVVNMTPITEVAQ